MEKCSRKNLCKNEDCTECFERSFASHEKSKYWDYSRNFTIEEVVTKDDTKTYEIIEVEPRSIAKGTHTKYNFICGVCNHHFMISLDKIIYSNNWCSYCVNQKLCDDENCLVCFNKSFASVSRSKEWDFEKNIKKPRDVFKSTHASYFFICKICNHPFKKNVSNISRKNSWCPYCTNKKLCEDENCVICEEKSFLSNPFSKFWDYERNEILPRNVFGCSSKKFYFSCDKCNHDFVSPLYNMKKGVFCPYCGHQKLCSDENCDFCLKNSFKSVPKSSFWDYNKNKQKPRDVFKCSKKKFYFVCENKHKFSTNLGNIVKGGNCCPSCKNKTEKLFIDLLEQNNIKYKHQPKFDWCVNEKTCRKLPFDFLLPDFNMIVEIDGPQHFKQVKNWRSPELQIEIDNYKAKLAIENGYSIIRVLQEPLLKKSEKTFGKIKKDLFSRDSPLCIFLGEGYEKHTI